MKLASVAKPLNSVNLQLIKQIGVNDLVYYDMNGMPATKNDLERVVRETETFGVHVSVMEAGPVMDLIVLGKSGREKQIEQYKQSLKIMGECGVKTLCYNFMPQVLSDSMVVRTSFEHLERGGARTTRFNFKDFHEGAILHQEKSTSDEEMWGYLEYFLKEVIPVAETYGVKMAMHPDDPPLSPMCGLSRIMRSADHLDRLLSMVDSPSNGITFCQGCFLEMGENLLSLVQRFGKRINFVHFRDVAGTPDDFWETFPDNGPTNMVELLKAFREINYQGYARVDHVPRLVTEQDGEDLYGYGMQGHMFAIGYLKGLMEPIFGKPAPERIL